MGLKTSELHTLKYSLLATFKNSSLSLRYHYKVFINHLRPLNASTMNW